MNMPPASRPLILVGAVQGIVLWWLWQAVEYQRWPHDVPILMGALLWAALAVPAAIYLSESAGFSVRRRWRLVAGTGFAYLLLGAYAGWVGDAMEAVESGRRFSAAYGSFAQILASLVLGFMLIPLAAGRHGGRWQYHRLFELAWRNALLGISVVLITVLFWAVLYAGALLMKSLGLGFIKELIEKPVFVFPVTGMVVGAVFAQGHARAEALVTLRHYVLALQAWLLPLLLLFGVMWLLALPFTGLEPLFGTRSAAFTLLWFTALAVHLLNCAWQDGRQASLYPRWLAAFVRFAWLTLPVVTLVAGWALWLRIRQYGWTEERIWALFVWLIAAGHALGYALSLLPALQRRLLPRSHAGAWMASVPGSNIGMAVLMLFALALLAGPVGDPRRLAVSDQIARLEASKVEPAEFDYRYLRWGADRWGTMALQELAAAKGDARTADIAGRARQALAEKQRWGGGDDKKAEVVLSHAEARQRLQQLKAEGSRDAIPDSLVDFLRQSGKPQYQDCLHQQNSCAVWMQDFNADGRQEALVLVSHSAGRVKDKPAAWLYAEQEKGWEIVAEFSRRFTQEEWSAAIRDGQITLAPPEWKDILLSGNRLHARTWSQ